MVTDIPSSINIVSDSYIVWLGPSIKKEADIEYNVDGMCFLLLMGMQSI